jgi:hypothetical protein
MAFFTNVFLVNYKFTHLTSLYLYWVETLFFNYYILWPVDFFNRMGCLTLWFLFIKYAPNSVHGAYSKRLYVLFCKLLSLEGEVSFGFSSIF